MTADICGSQRYESTTMGWLHPIEPYCLAVAVYEIQLTIDGSSEWYGMCPDHTAWARASWSAVTGVRQVTT